MNKANLAVLILSCDKYNDLWDGCYYQFAKYFKLDIPVYFASNNLSPSWSDSKIKIIHTGPEKNWGENFKRAIEQVNSQYIFVTLEDLYICSEINDDGYVLIQSMLERQLDLKHLKYTGFIQGNKEVMKGVKILDAGTPYRVTLCGIWQKEYLLSIIDDLDTPWIFEVDGSVRTQSDKGFYSLEKPLYQSVNMVEKGYWITSSLRWALQNQIPVNPQSRFRKSSYQDLTSFIKDHYFNMMMKVSLDKKRKILSLVKKILVLN